MKKIEAAEDKFSQFDRSVYSIIKMDAHRILSYSNMRESMHSVNEGGSLCELHFGRSLHKLVYKGEI